MGLICAVIFCMPTISTADVDVAIWKENGDHIFIINSVEHNVGGECYNIEKEYDCHRYTWQDRLGMFHVSTVKKIFVEVNGNLILVEEY